MNNLAYTSQQPDKVVPKIEEILRKDLGVDAPVPLAVEDVNVSKANVGSMVHDAGLVLFGGKEALLFTVAFDIAAPRPVKLTAQVNRVGIGCHVGTLVFSTKIAKPVKGEVALEAPKTFGASKFQGDVEAAGKLNASKDLLKRVDKFSRTKSDVGGGIRMDRYFKLAPAESGSVLVVGTLPRATSMGMGATTDAKEFIDIAKMIEDLL
jgi:hypothetical protein